MKNNITQQTLFGINFTNKYKLPNVTHYVLPRKSGKSTDIIERTKDYKNPLVVAYNNICKELYKDKVTPNTKVITFHKFMNTPNFDNYDIVFIDEYHSCVVNNHLKFNEMYDKFGRINKVLLYSTPTKMYDASYILLDLDNTNMVYDQFNEMYGNYINNFYNELDEFYASMLNPRINIIFTSKTTNNGDYLTRPKIFMLP